MDDPENTPGQAAADETAAVLLAAAGMDEADDMPPSDSEDRPTDVLQMARVIDGFFARAIEEHSSAYGPDGASVVKEIMLETAQFTAVDFVEAYRSGQVYPEERLSELVLRFTDVRLQEWYLQFDAGVSNESYFAPTHLDPSLLESPNLKLRLMATTQSVIGRSRIAWEKLMRAVYYMETGADLKPSNARSCKSKFFDWVDKQPKWRFLDAYESVVEEHDSRFRTGEFHKGSILRRVVLGHEMPDLNEVMELSNSMMNGIWPNILDIARGDWPRQFSPQLFIPGVGIDPRYLPPTEPG